MKFRMIIILYVTSLSSVCFAGEKLDLSNSKARENYSVGYQIGSDFKRQGVDINPELLLKGAQDAVSMSEPQMTYDEMRATLGDLKKKINDRSKAKGHHHHEGRSKK